VTERKKGLTLDYSPGFRLKLETQKCLD
jgi:hypothetical protein